MFEIKLCYVPSDHKTQISALGKVITYNGVEYDFSGIPVGGEVEATLPALGTIKNINGVIHLEVMYHEKEIEAEPLQSTDINDYIISLNDAELISPITLRQVQEV